MKLDENIHGVTVVIPPNDREIRVFDMPARQRRGRCSSPPRKRSVSPRNRVVSSFSMLERDSSAGRSSPAGSPTTATKRASVLLLRAPPHGASVVGEQVGVGVGLQMSTSGDFFVSSVLHGTPAAQAVEGWYAAVGCSVLQSVVSLHFTIYV